MHPYDVVTGVSGGAINAAILANHTMGEEEVAADRMIEFWENATENPLYKDWIGGYL